MSKVGVRAGNQEQTPGQTSGGVRLMASLCLQIQVELSTWKLQAVHGGPLLPEVESMAFQGV